MNIKLVDDDWLAIKQAYILIQSMNLAKIEDKKWMMYKVGEIVRLDIK